MWIFLNNGFIRGDLKRGGEKYGGKFWYGFSRDMVDTGVSGSADVISEYYWGYQRYVSDNMKGEMCFIREEYVKLAGQSIGVG